KRHRLRSCPPPPCLRASAPWSHALALRAPGDGNGSETISARNSIGASLATGDSLSSPMMRCPLKWTMRHPAESAPQRLRPPHPGFLVRVSVECRDDALALVVDTCQ